MQMSNFRTSSATFPDRYDIGKGVCAEPLFESIAIRIYSNGTGPSGPTCAVALSHPEAVAFANLIIQQVQQAQRQ